MEAEGFEVTIDPRGPGAHAAIASLFIDHLREMAASHGFLK
jgi:cobalamin biosynthesis Co2+ chelatase CbiK